eukprot:59325-Hanusia_phi.AAC.1
MQQFEIPGWTQCRSGIVARLRMAAAAAAGKRGGGSAAGEEGEGEHQQQHGVLAAGRVGEARTEESDITS